MIVVMTTASLATIKAHLSQYVASVHETHERVTITRNGEPVAMLVSPDDLASLEETIAVLSSPQAMADIREAEAAVFTGSVMTLNELCHQLRPDT